MIGDGEVQREIGVRIAVKLFPDERCFLNGLNRNHALAQGHNHFWISGVKLHDQAHMFSFVGVEQGYLLLFFRVYHVEVNQANCKPQERYWWRSRKGVTRPHPVAWRT